MPYPYYNPYQYQPMPDSLQQLRTYQSLPQQQDDRIWVSGQNAAEAYLLAPNAFVRLWDSQSPVFYEKRADSTGKPYMDIYEYSRKGVQTPAQQVITATPKVDYTAEIEALKARIKALEEKEVKTDE